MLNHKRLKAVFLQLVKLTHDNSEGDKEALLPGDTFRKKIFLLFEDSSSSRLVSSSIE
jgi:hypothetical protein